MKTATKLTKLSAFLLCLALSITMLVPVASAETDPNAISISSEADFVAIGNDATGSYVLTQDITLSASYAPLTGFAGTLDGAGHTITLNLVDVADSQYGNSGLFKVSNGATIKDLTLEGTISNNTTASGIEIGSFVGNATNTTLINCVSNVKITFGTSTGAKAIGGGLVGHAASETVSLTNCVNNGEVSGTFNGDVNLGGLVGYAKSATLTINGCVNNGAVSATRKSGTMYVGGVMGWGNDASVVTISNTKNYGSVTASGSAKVGGFVGFIYGNTAFTNCENYGNVNATDAAGILCIIGNKCPSVSFRNCVNFGDITGTANHVAGITAGSYQSCTGKSLKIEISHCANYGKVSNYSTGNSVYVGGILARTNGLPAGSTVEYCYNAGAVEAPNGTSGYSGAIAGAEGAVTYTNNYSVATSLNLFGHNDGGNLKYKTNNVQIDANTDLAAVVATLNTGLETPAYRLNDGQIEALYSLNSAPVTNYGVQETKAENGAFAVRFIGLLNSKSFTEAGFTVSATIKQEGKADVVVTDKDCKVTSAFDSLLAGNEDITIGTETVKSPLGTDFFAYTITGIPANATVTFTFTPYATASTTVTGATYTVTYVNGVLA